MIGEAAGVRILLFDFPARIRGEQAIQNEWRFVHSGRDFLGCEWPELIGHMGIGFDAWIVAVFCIDQVHSLPGRRFANANLPRGQYQMPHFPHHKNFATFDYSAAAVTQPQIEPFCSGQFTEEAHNLILVGGTGTGKTHIAIALGTTLISNGKKAFGISLEPVAFDALLFNTLQRRRPDQRPDQGTGRGQCREDHPAALGPGLRHHPLSADCCAIACRAVDELGYIPFPKSGGALVHRANGAPRCLLILLTPSDQQALREDQCHHHYEPGVRRMGLGLR